MPSGEEAMSASRLAALPPSPIRKVSEGAPVGAIPLGLGEPTWALPEPARQALAAESGPCAYGPNAGLPELREALARWHGATVAEVRITCGAQGALFALMQGLLEPGDQVLVPDPGFPAYAALARLAGAEPVPYALEGGSFRLSADAFTEALAKAPRARIALFNHPANPTGAGASRGELEGVLGACAARGVLAVGDEVYRELHFGDRSPSLRDVDPAALVISSASKGWGAPGLRVGWMVGPEAVVQAAGGLHAWAVTAAAAPCQRAALALLEASDTVLPAARRELEARWLALAAAWATHVGTPLVRPDGAFYAWLPLPAFETDALACCLRLRDEAGVVLVPGSAFGPGGGGHVRLSFGALPEQITEGVRRLAPHWRTA
jgi:aspartate/methionine/tyrosine aminotransferase